MAPGASLFSGIYRFRMGLHLRTPRAAQSDRLWMLFGSPAISAKFSGSYRSAEPLVPSLARFRASMLSAVLTRNRNPASAGNTGCARTVPVLRRPLAQDSAKVPKNFKDADLRVSQPQILNEPRQCPGEDRGRRFRSPRCFAHATLFWLFRRHRLSSLSSLAQLFSPAIVSFQPPCRVRLATVLPAARMPAFSFRPLRPRQPQLLP